MRYTIELTESEMLLLSAATTIAAITTRIPEVFATIQLDTHFHPDAPTSYAKAALVLIDNQPAFLSLVEKLSLEVS